MSTDYKNNAEYERQEQIIKDWWKGEADEFTYKLYRRILSLRDDINSHLDFYCHHLEDVDSHSLYKIVEAIEEQIPFEVQQYYKEQT